MFNVQASCFTNAFKVEDFSAHRSEVMERYYRIIRTPISELIQDMGFTVRIGGISIQQYEQFLNQPSYDLTPEEIEFSKNLVARLEEIEADFPNREYDGATHSVFEGTKKLLPRVIAYFKA